MSLRPEAASVLSGGGEVGALLRAHDWTRSPLGPPQDWPQSLRTLVSFLLNCKFPMFLAWGKDLTCLYNDAYAEILGEKHPCAVGKDFQQIWFEIWDDIRPLVAQALGGEAVYHENLPLTMRRKGYEEQTWFTFSYSPVRDESNMVMGMCVTCIETTLQVLAERERTKEIERLRQLFQQAPGIMAVVREPSHVFELVNDAYLQLVGRRDLIGKPVRTALPEVQGQGFFELLDGVFASGESYVGRALPVMLRRGAGTELEERFVDFVYQPIKNSSGHVTGIFIEGSDVTDAVKSLTALRESEQRLLQLANTIPHLTWMSNPDGYVHWYNDRWYEYTGTALEEVRGSGWERFFAAEDLPMMREKWLDSLATGLPYEVAVSMRACDGSFHRFYIRAAPLRDSVGRIVQWFGTNTDVTDLQRAQDELKEANRRKDEFLAMLAHELRNPLAPISTAAELLKLTSLDEERIRQTSNIISRQVDHMTELVDDLLDVSRVTRGLVELKEERVNLKEVIMDAVEQVHSLMEVKRQHFTVSAPDGPAWVKGDPTRLIQVFANIVNNAAKYTPEDGQIAVRLSLLKDEINVVIQDNGIGILPPLLPHIFDLFTQAERSPDRSQGGLGLGLALVKSLVELHAGSVAAESGGSGKGSTFTVRLPALQHKAKQAAVREPAAPTPRPDAPLTVLVVDDNVDAARTLGLLLQTFGHTVHIEHTAQSAIRVAMRQAPHVLFLDIGLPDIDGYDLARRIREMPATRESVLVAVTGYGQSEDMARSRTAGFDHHLVKPVRLSSIADVLDGVKRRAPDRPSPA